MPRIKSHIANLDNRFVTLEKFDGHFNMRALFGSGVPKIVMPFKLTKHINKFLNDGWILGKSLRLGYDRKGLFVNLIFEKEKPHKRTDGNVIGIDRGFNAILYIRWARNRTRTQREDKKWR